MSHFREHYSRLHDDELVEIALTRELTPEASEALDAELKERGIDNLSERREIRQKEIEAEDKRRHEAISLKESLVLWRTRFLYASAFLSCTYGIYRLSVQDKAHPGDDGGLMLVIGVAIFLFAAITSRLSRLWIKHVLHRKPPV